MKVVIITGLKGSGKDTLGQHFLNVGYKLGKFSSLLKEATSILGGYEEGFWETDKKNEIDHNGLHPREFITTISEGLKKRYGRDIITKLTLPKIVKDLEGSDIVFTDARFPDAEVKPVIEYFGKENVTVIEVQREEVTPKGFIFSIKKFLAKRGLKFKDPLLSPTEIFIEDIEPNMIIYNDRTLGDLEEIAKAIISQI